MLNEKNLQKEFGSPSEEIEYLRERVKQSEEKARRNFSEVNTDSIIRDEIRSYAALPEDIIPKGQRVMENHAKEIVLELTPETHDKKIEELFGVLEEKGIKNALTILAHFKNPHLEDDFHRFLVQYVKSGYGSSSESIPVSDKKALRHTLFEVSFPLKKPDEKEKPLKEVLTMMEQFYMGLIGATGEKEDRNYFSIEVANPEGDKETAFYVSVPDTKKDLFEKQIISVFPDVKIFERKDDYNIFNYGGEFVCGFATLHENSIFPIKTYDAFDYDPLNIILNAFSKLEKDTEGAALQIVLEPEKGDFLWSYKDALKKLEAGIKPKEALDMRHSFAGYFGKTVKDIFLGAAKEMIMPGGTSSSEKKPENNGALIEEVKQKIATPLCHAAIRIVASAKTYERAHDIFESIKVSFSQFEKTTGNKFKWHKVEGESKFHFARAFSYRAPVKSESIPLSIREITTIVHFPDNIESSPHLRVATSASAPAPVGLPESGVTLGINADRNTTTVVRMLPEDRLRHMYVIGQTGTGKTTLLKNMIIQDIKAGDGVCFIDPHGSDINDILAAIPKERINDVIYFDPGHSARPMGLNMLEYDPAFPEQKTFVVNELLSIFNKLFDMKVAGGPMFEQYFRNSVQLVMDSPESGNTLLEVMRVLSSKEFRNEKLSTCKNPLVVQFWREIAEKAGGESSLQNMVPYITNKFDVFLSNDVMRTIVLQEESAFNLREIMDTKKIFLVNLSKGRLGEINANLLGLILVGKILMAALSRVDSFGKTLPPFYLFMDEFQNITTSSISDILSEARKYGLSLTVAHQFIAQLDEKIKDAVFGNVGSVAAFRVGAEDSEFLKKQFEPVFSETDLMNLDNRQCFIRLLSHGKPLRPFSMHTLPPEKGMPEIAPKIKELSYLRYGKDRLLVEDEIMSRYKKPAPEPPRSLETPL